MTGKLKKDQDMQYSMEEDKNVEAFNDSSIEEETEIVSESEDVNSKGGEASDDGLGEYEVGNFDSINIEDEDSPRRSQADSTDRI